jgi:DNA-binding beta-propeller fold protein YncE
METPMWKTRHRLWFAPGLLVLGTCACAVFITSNNVNIRLVTLTPANPAIAIGDVQQFIANVTYDDGVVTQPAPAYVLWESSDPYVAVVDSQGRATGLRAGSAVVTGTYMGVSGSTVLAVVKTIGVGVRVSGSASELNVKFLKSGRSFSYLVNPADDTISIYETGGHQAVNRLQGVVSVAPAQGPGWLAVSSSGKFLYVANHKSANISVFVIDPATGRLGSVPGSPFDVEGGAWIVAVNPSGGILSATDLRTSSVTDLNIDAESGALERSLQR